MATDSQSTRDLRDVQASDFQTIPKPKARLDPEVMFAPTCMMWCIVLGLGFLVGLMLLWSIPMLLGKLGPG
jgi:hypothetical protein